MDEQTRLAKPDGGKETVWNLIKQCGKGNEKDQINLHRCLNSHERNRKDIC